MTDPLASSWVRPPSLRSHVAVGRDARARLPRTHLADLSPRTRDPLDILRAQDADRVPELVPLRRERMSASAFAFYRGTAAIMAADLADDRHTGIVVASCGDAHVANFGFYASPQRTLVFDLNDFDEAAWAPWEWDLKRLVTSIVIAGQATGRAEDVVDAAALSAVRTYARSLAAAVQRSPLDRYFAHFDAAVAVETMDRDSRRTLRRAIRDARKRTGERAARKLTHLGEDGRLVFVEQPPTMVHADPDLEARVHAFFADYVSTTNVDIRMLLQQYLVSDLARRVVGVGSVGTRCFVAALQDAEDNALILQAKEAVRSVLEEHGGIVQPDVLTRHIERSGEGGRVVALQRILQAVSDPFLGYLRNHQPDQPVRDFYVRQFHDMKGGFDMEELDDLPFARYADACAATLARAHAQSPRAPAIVGYLGGGRTAGTALLAWSHAYAERSRGDYERFIAS